MGKKSKRRRARRRANAIWAYPKGDKLDIQAKTDAGKAVLEDARQGETFFYVGPKRVRGIPVFDKTEEEGGEWVPAPWL
jgi:hypothetical protein